MAKEFKVKLNEKISIDFEEPLPEYHRHPLKAYRATYKFVETVECYAIVCNRVLAPRIGLAEAYAHKDFLSLARLVDHGPVMCPYTEQEQYVFVYDRTYRAKKFIEQDNPDVHLGLPPSLILEKVIPAFIRALTYLNNNQISHGSICLSNIYGHYQEGILMDVSFGDMLSLPCGYAQKSLYRTIAASNVDANGYGRGHIKDDIYAFGVCVALMLRQHVPYPELSHEGLVNAKFKYSTYNTLVGKERFGNSLFEFLKGVLQDDVSKRWGLDELLLWQDGRSMTPLQPTRSKVVPRPLKFNGKSFEKVEPLARELPKNVTEANELIESDKLGQWVERSLSEAKITRRYEEAMAISRVSLKADEKIEVLVSAMTSALDDGNPIYYRGMCFYPYGVSTKIIEAFEQGNDVNVFAEVFRNNIITTWFNFQSVYGHNVGGLLKDLERCSTYIRDHRLGHGLERCAYRLDRHIPCMSHSLKQYYVQEAQDLALILKNY